MMKSLASAFGLFLALLLISSCSVDENSGVSVQGENRLAGTLVGVQQAAETLEHPAGYLFYIDADGIILASVPLLSMNGVMEAVSENDVSVLDQDGIVEIRDRAIIEKVFSSIGDNGACMSLSEIETIGVMDYSDCVLECCGSLQCEWSKLKYCISKCAEDHDPKQE